ncbi:MAG: RNA polymerase factor sigma-54 [marine benthic group bacterium]|nr:RNA polymerase factor sigma-54 [Candidatus Benthicola marisminoris]
MANFRRGLSQSLGMRQELKINPRLYQAMDLLYMPLLDLQAHLKQEVLVNPFLEFSEMAEEELPEEKEEEEDEDEVDWEEILLNGFDAGGRRSQFEDKEHYMPTPAAPPDLWEHLREQLNLLKLGPREFALGEEIIGNIDREGFLTCSLEEVVEALNIWLAESEPDLWAEMEPFTLEEAESVLAVIQGFYPSGVGARDLRETLLIQLRDRKEDETLAFRIIRDHFDQLVNHRWSELSKEHGISPKDVQAAADSIAKLDPKPGLKYADMSDNYVIPDLVVEKVDDEYFVFHNDSSLPRLKLSRSYREVAQDRNQFQGENKAFISKKLNSAQWMIQAIEQRRQTMLKVMSFIVDRQRDFFEKGVEHLRPLTLREVAEHIDMHESTVSRVTNDKYVQTPRGVLPLKFFFSSGLSTDYGEDVSARGIRARIQKLVADEDPKKPLTDQAIVDVLKKEGVQIARRTVAKYRDQLGILSARMRKRV